MQKTCILSIAFLLFLGTYLLHGQSLFTETEIALANTADTVSYLSGEEKKVILYMNLARLDGKRFYKSFFHDYIRKYNNTYSNKIKGQNKYWVSLILDLNKTSGLNMILPNRKLSEAAKFHANDLGKAGILGHNSSDGTNFSQRLERFLPNLHYAGENCCCGLKMALDIVCDLLLDNGVPSLGHRKNILDAGFNIVGVSIAPHSTCDPCSVIDFSKNP